MSRPRPHTMANAENTTLDSPPTLMGMMMSCNDLPSTLHSPPQRHAHPEPFTPHRNPTFNRAGSIADTSTSTASTAVDAPHAPAITISHVSHATSPSKQNSDITEEFIQITHPSPTPSSDASPKRSGSPELSPPRSRGRLGHIVSIEGIKRSLSQSDLRAVGRKGSTQRIKGVMFRLGRNISQQWKHGEGETKRPASRNPAL